MSGVDLPVEIDALRLEYTSNKDNQIDSSEKTKFLLSQARDSRQPHLLLQVCFLRSSPPFVAPAPAPLSALLHPFITIADSDAMSPPPLSFEAFSSGSGFRLSSMICLKSPASVRMFGCDAPRYLVSFSIPLLARCVRTASPVEFGLVLTCSCESPSLFLLAAFATWVRSCTVFSYSLVLYDDERKLLWSEDLNYSSAIYCLLVEVFRMFSSGVSPVKETLGFLIRANVFLVQVNSKSNQVGFTIFELRRSKPSPSSLWKNPFSLYFGVVFFKPPTIQLVQRPLPFSNLRSSHRIKLIPPLVSADPPLTRLSHPKKLPSPPPSSLSLRSNSLSCLVPSNPMNVFTELSSFVTVYTGPEETYEFVSMNIGGRCSLSKSLVTNFKLSGFAVKSLTYLSLALNLLSIFQDDLAVLCFFALNLVCSDIRGWLIFSTCTFEV